MHGTDLGGFEPAQTQVGCSVTALPVLISRMGFSPFGSCGRTIGLHVSQAGDGHNAASQLLFHRCQRASTPFLSHHSAVPSVQPGPCHQITHKQVLPCQLGPSSLLHQQTLFFLFGIPHKFPVAGSASAMLPLSLAG